MKKEINVLDGNFNFNSFKNGTECYIVKESDGDISRIYCNHITAPDTTFKYNVYADLHSFTFDECDDAWYEDCTMTTVSQIITNNDSSVNAWIIEMKRFETEANKDATNRKISVEFHYVNDINSISEEFANKVKNVAIYDATNTLGQSFPRCEESNTLYKYIVKKRKVLMELLEMDVIEAFEKLGGVFAHKYGDGFKNVSENARTHLKQEYADIICDEYVILNEKYDEARKYFTHVE